MGELQKLGEFGKRLDNLGVDECSHDSDLDVYSFAEWLEEAKKEFPFASWLKEDLEELKITIKQSVKERGHSVLDDEVSEEFIKTLDAIVKWFGEG